MDASAVGECVHASFDTMEDAAAYPFGDGSNDNVVAVDASLTVAAATMVVEEADESLTKRL